MENEKLIKNFSVLIGQDFFRSTAPVLSVCVNETYTTVKLEDIKNWFNTIWESNGNRSEESYKAKKELDMFFGSILSQFMDFNNLNKET